MRKVSRRRLAKTAVALLAERPQDRAVILRMLAAYLIVHKQQKQVDLVLLDVAQELQASVGHLYADIASAFPLENASRSELETYLKGVTKSSSVEFNERIDASLLAGMIVKTSELELDTSARSKLNQLSSLNVNTPNEA